MAIVNYLISTYNLNHLFTLNDATREATSTGISTTGAISSGTGAFVALPVCEGFSNSLQSTDTSGTTKCFVIGNTADINTGTNIWNTFSIMVWFNIPVIDVPTCIYEQGGGTNNMAINVGLAKAITSQAADAGEPFLIAQSNFLAQPNRNYFIVHNWLKYTEHSGTGNKIQLIINGVLQEEVEDTGTAQFPNHSGDISAGNSAGALQSYNGSTQNFYGRQKRVGLLGLSSNLVITEANAREIFERTVLPELTIEADTVQNQQAALDVLINSTYAGVNCALRIIQATDATDYRLFVDSITVAQDIYLKDIAIQFVGTGVLTLENTNGSNIVEVSTPAEVERVSGVLVGGGSIVLVEDTYRTTSVQDISNISTTKLVLEEAGDYTLTNVILSEIENVSGGIINITSNLGVPTVTNTGAGSTTNVIDSVLTFSGNWELYTTESDRNISANAVAQGGNTDTFEFTYVAGTTYYLWVDSIRWSVLPTSTGETSVNLSTAALLSVVKTDLGFIENIVYLSMKKETNGVGSNSDPFNSVDDAIVKAEKINASYVSILDTSAVNPAMPTVSAEGINFKGKNKPTCFLNPNNQNFTHSQLSNMRIFGDFSASTQELVMERNLLLGVTNINGEIKNCKFLGDVSFNGDSYLDDCNINNSIPPNVSILGAYTVEMEEVEGNFVMADMPVGSIVIISIQGGTVTLGAGCLGDGGYGTAAIVILRGHYTLIRNDNGQALVIEDKIGSVTDLAAIELYAQQAAQNSDYLKEN